MAQVPVTAGSGVEKVEEWVRARPLPIMCNNLTRDEFDFFRQEYVDALRTHYESPGFKILHGDTYVMSVFT